MGQLNIKDVALIAEAKELAAMLGTTATGAVREAVAEKLAREKAARQRKFDAIMRKPLINRSRSRLSESRLNSTIGSSRQWLEASLS